jgi:hypothetical protein
MSEDVKVLTNKIIDLLVEASLSREENWQIAVGVLNYLVNDQ